MIVFSEVIPLSFREYPQGTEGFQNARRGSSTAGRQAGVAAAYVSKTQSFELDCILTKESLNTAYKLMLRPQLINRNSQWAANGAFDWLTY